jgi:hypothetical protein
VRPNNLFSYWAKIILNRLRTKRKFGGKEKIGWYACGEEDAVIGRPQCQVGETLRLVPGKNGDGLRNEFE